MPEPIHLENVDWQEWRHSEEIRLRYRPLSDEPGCHIGIALEELPPGCRTGSWTSTPWAWRGSGRTRSAA